MLLQVEPSELPPGLTAQLDWETKQQERSQPEQLTA
jgi:hypothetical protein